MSKNRWPIIVILLILLLIWWWQWKSTEPGSIRTPPDAGGPIRPMDENDRPPIIIGDGSVDFYVDFNGNKYGRGQWMSDDNVTWTLVPGKDSEGNADTRPVLRFAATILNVKQNSPELCMYPDKPFLVESFTLDFNGLGDGATVKITDGKVQVVFPGKAEMHFPFWIESKQTVFGHRLKSVKFGDTECQFAGGHRGLIRVKPIL